MVDWITFFVQTIERIREPLSIVLTASGCREGWVQGELYRAGRAYDLRVNEHAIAPRQTADISCGSPPSMLAELKIVGADYYPKMQGFIEEDVGRMRRAAAPGTETYVILIIPRSQARTRLGAFLEECSFSSECTDRDFETFRLRIWRL